MANERLVIQLATDSTEVRRGFEEVKREARSLAGVVDQTTGRFGGLAQAGGRLDDQFRKTGASVRGLAQPLLTELGPAFGQTGSQISSVLASAAALGGGWGALAVAAGGLAGIVGARLIGSLTEADRTTKDVTASVEDQTVAWLKLGSAISTAEGQRAAVEKSREPGQRLAPGPIALATERSEAFARSLEPGLNLPRDVLDRRKREFERAAFEPSQDEAKAFDPRLLAEGREVTGRINALNDARARAGTDAATRSAELEGAAINRERQRVTAGLQAARGLLESEKTLAEGQQQLLGETAAVARDFSAERVVLARVQAAELAKLAGQEAAAQVRSLDAQLADKRRQLGVTRTQPGFETDLGLQREAVNLTADIDRLLDQRLDAERRGADEIRRVHEDLARDLRILDLRSLQERAQAAEKHFRLSRAAQDAGGSTLQSGFGLQRTLTPTPDERLAQLRADAVAPRFSLENTEKALEQARALVERHRETLAGGGSLSASDAERFFQAQSFLNRFEETRRGRGIGETVRDSFREFTSPVGQLEGAATTFSTAVDRFAASVAALEGQAALPAPAERAMPKYETGAWRVPETRPALVHKDEMILPAEEAERLRAIHPGARLTFPAAPPAELLPGARLTFPSRAEPAESVPGVRPTFPRSAAPAESLPGARLTFPAAPGLVEPRRPLTTGVATSEALAERIRTAPTPELADRWASASIALSRQASFLRGGTVDEAGQATGRSPATFAPHFERGAGGAMASLSLSEIEMGAVIAQERASGRRRNPAADLANLMRGGSGDPWSEKSMAAFERFTGQPATGRSRETFGAYLEQARRGGIGLRRGPSGLAAGDRIEFGGIASGATGRQGGTLTLEGPALRKRFDEFERPSGPAGLLPSAGGARTTEGADRIDFGQRRVEGLGFRSAGTLEGPALRDRMEEFAGRGASAGTATLLTTQGGASRGDSVADRVSFPDTRASRGPVGDLKHSASDAPASARADAQAILGQIGQSMAGGGGQDLRAIVKSTLEEYRETLLKAVADALPRIIQRERALR